MKQLPPFTDEELEAMKAILDAGVKSIGLNACMAAAIILQKMNAATDVVPEAPENPEGEDK